MQFLAAFIMKGRLQAMTVASTLALLSMLFPPVSIVSSASVALVTLRNGAKEGLFVLISSCLAAAVLGMVLLGGYQFALVYGLVLWMPVWLISIILREGRNLITALEVTVLLGCMVTIGFYVYLPEPAALWRGLLEVMTQQLQAQSDAPVEIVKRSVDAFSHYMTGAVAAGSAYGLLFGLFLARWWQAKLYNPGGFQAEYLALKGHRQLAVVTVIVAAAAALTSGLFAELCWNMLIVLSVVYIFTGTALLHCSFAVMKGSRFMVPFLYITLFAIPHIMLLIAICGLSDTWLNLRNKLKPNGA